MGKVLIAINTAGFFLNVLVFLMVVNLSGGEHAASDKPGAPPGPTLDAIAGKVEQILDKRLTKLAAMDTKLQSLTSKMEILSKKVAAPPPAAVLPSAAPHADQPGNGEPGAEPAAVPAGRNPGAPAGNGEARPEEKPEAEEKTPENGGGGNA